MEACLSYFDNRRFSFELFRNLPHPRIAQSTDESKTAFELFKLVSDSKSDLLVGGPLTPASTSVPPPLTVLSIQVTALPVGHADNSTEDHLLRFAADVYVTNTDNFRKPTATGHALLLTISVGLRGFEAETKWQNMLSGLTSFDSNSDLLTTVIGSMVHTHNWGRRTLKQPEPTVREVLHSFEKGPMEEAKQPAGMTVTMKDYQLQSLHWMLDKVWLHLCRRSSLHCCRHVWFSLWLY
jgi:hypothetical protein